MRQIETPLKPQLFNSGLATIWQVSNTAAPGDKPKYRTIKLFALPYQDRRLSDARYYAALQVDSKISRVIRVPRVSGIQPSGDLVTLSGDPRQYKTAKVSESSYTVPESMDLTLEISKTEYKLQEDPYDA